MQPEHAFLMLRGGAMAVTLNDEVLVASKVSGPQMASNCLKISRLRSSFSGAASMTSALPLVSSRLVLV